MNSRKIYIDITSLSASVALMGEVYRTVISVVGTQLQIGELNNSIAF